MDPETERRLAMIAPERRALVARRIDVLDRFAAIMAPTLADADRAAAELGLARNSFYRLYAVWTAFRDPSAIGAGGGARGPLGRRDHPGDDFVRRVHPTLPRGRSIGQDVNAIETLAAEEGVTVRSKTSLKKLVRELRGETDEIEPVGADAFIDHVVVQTPVMDREGPTMPVASVLGDPVEGRIVALLLGIQPPSPSTVAALLHHAVQRGSVRQGERRDPFRLAMETGFGTSWAAVDRILAAHGIRRIGEEHRRLPGGRAGGGLVYPRLLGLTTHSRLILRSPEQRRPLVRERLDDVLRLEDAQAAMDARVEACGDGRPLLLPTDPAALAAALSAET